MQLPLSYRFGASIVVRAKNDWKVTVFERGDSEKTESKGFKNILPIPKNCSLASTLQSFVDQILAKKQANPDSDTSSPEKQIDQLVYKLYDLTDDEIYIIEK